MTELLAAGRFGLPVDAGAVARDWAARGYSCRSFVDPPAREWRDFTHDTNELAAVVEGRLEMTVAGESFAMDPGDEAFIPRGAAHSVKNIDAGATRWLFGYDRGPRRRRRIEPPPRHQPRH